MEEEKEEINVSENKNEIISNNNNEPKKVINMTI